jgi:hypothetical protein
VELKLYIGIDIVIGHDIEDAPKRHSLYTRYVHDIEVLIRYRVRYRIAISRYKDIEGKNFDVSSILVQCRDIRISNFSLRYQRFCRYRVRYAIPGAAGRTDHVPAPPTGPVRTNLLVLDPLGRSVLLRDCLGALSCWGSAQNQLTSFAAAARPWYGLPAGHGGQS